MSRKTYSGANINWGSFDEWSTAVSSDSNTSIATAMGNMFPANTSPFSASELSARIRAHINRYNRLSNHKVEHKKVKRLIDYFVLGLFLVFYMYTFL